MAKRRTNSILLLGSSNRKFARYPPIKRSRDIKLGAMSGLAKVTRELVEADCQAFV